MALSEVSRACADGSCCGAFTFTAPPDADGGDGLPAVVFGERPCQTSALSLVCNVWDGGDKGGGDGVVVVVTGAPIDIVWDKVAGWAVPADDYAGADVSELGNFTLYVRPADGVRLAWPRALLLRLPLLLCCDAG